jgi:prepilin-type N-terminal cleavage/methylation domain-containing protein
VKTANAPRNRGFTLIELLTTLCVLCILALIALPSFSEMRQRAAIRGAADASLAFWNDARLEAVKRNQRVKVGIYIASDGAFCFGAATTEDPADSTVCDCRTATPTTNACNVSRYPTDQDEWNGVTVASLDLGGGSIDASRPAIIEPMRTSLTEAADAGSITLAGPDGPSALQLSLAVDRLGRGHLCEPADVVDSLSEFHSRRCAE